MPSATFVQKHTLNAVTAALFLVATWRLGLTAELPAVLVFIFGGVLLAVIDWKVHRLPTRLVYYTLAGVLTGLLFAAVVSGDWRALSTAAIGAVIFFNAMAALWYVQRHVGFMVLGFGDVRLALVLGALLGWYGLPYIWYGAMAGVVIAALIGLGLAIKHRTLEMTMAFGPPLLIGALAVVLAHA
jgi:leader peptidase (prepilin peptidase)/N-methyltransferase